MVTLVEVYNDAVATLKEKSNTSFATWATSWFKQEEGIDKKLNLLAIWKRARETVLKEIFKSNG